jgi:hypothetical protein
MQMQGWKHICNAFCGDGLHCDLFHTSPNSSESKIMQALGYYQGLKVRRAEPAREPPPLTGTEPVLAPGNREDATEPWLVWWEAD